MKALLELLKLADLAALAIVFSFGWARLMERLADGPVCTCSKGKVCAACLAESEAIRPKPEREAA